MYIENEEGRNTMKYLTENEIVVNDIEDAFKIAKHLIKNDYVVMISHEYVSYVVNFIWSERGADRNDVIFRDRGDFEYEEDEEIEKIRKEIEEECLTK